MDSNNGPNHIGIGEREGRILSSLVKERHFGLIHGIGRSGNIIDLQPKAVGSSLLYHLTNSLMVNFLHSLGLTFVKDLIVFPLATGMSLTLVYQTLRLRNTLGKYVIFPRIDQKTCLKSIITAGLIPIIIEPRISDELDQLDTDLELIQKTIESETYYDYKSKAYLNFRKEEILCVSSVTSCFAPRSIDNVIELSILCKQQNIPHIVNSAYGIYCGKITEELVRSNTQGRVDAIVSSTDKNLLTPIGGSFIYGSNKDFIKEIGNNYPGRASMSPILDVFITLLEVGKKKYKAMMSKRLELFNSLYIDMTKIAEKYNERMLRIKRNKISMAMSLGSIKSSLDIRDSELTFLGGMFYNRQISGIKVIVPLSEKKVSEYNFANYGSHSNTHKEGNIPYIVFAVAIGVGVEEIEDFKVKFVSCIDEFIAMKHKQKKNTKQVA